MIHDFNNKVVSLVARWEKIYRMEVRKYNYVPISANVDPLLSNNELEEALERAEELLDQQIIFIKQYISFMMFEGKTHRHLADIKRFLSYQHWDKKFLHKQQEPAYQIVFWGGRSSSCGLNIRIEELFEFDFADSWAGEKYKVIGIYNRNWKKRPTKKRIKDLIKDIRTDFAGDGYVSDIKHQPNALSSNRGIYFDLNVKDDNALVMLRWLKALEYFKLFESLDEFFPNEFAELKN